MSEKCNERRSSPLEEVRSLYTELALHPEKDFGWGKGKENAQALGYETAWLERLPDVIWESAAAVGNPFSLGPIHPEDTVVDLGCGTGADLCVAALLVGNGGRVVGIDLTPAMVEKARKNSALMDFNCVEVLESDFEHLPLPDECADVVISNGAINLSPNKTCVLNEALRVLKSGGRLQIADMVRDDSKEVEEAGSDGSWAGCVTGTMAPACFVKMIEDAGFVRAELVRRTGYRTSLSTEGALLYAERY